MPGFAAIFRVLLEMSAIKTALKRRQTMNNIPLELYTVH